VNQTLSAQRQPYAWTVPVALLLGVAVSFACRLPIFTGLLTGYVWSTLYAKWLGHSWRVLLTATLSGMRKLWLICCVLLLVGGIVALWMDIGTIPTLVQLGSSFLEARNLVWMSFLLATALSMSIGSSIATWSILGPPLLAMTTPHWSPWIAGALVSGGMVGDRSSPMSSSIVLMSTACEVPLKRVLRQLNRSAALPFIVTLCAYVLVNQALHIPVIQPAHIQLFAGQWWIIVPPLLVILLALLRLPLLYNLCFAFILAVVMDELSARPTGASLVKFIWYGHLWSQADHVVHVGGVAPMLMAVFLIAAAGAFQGVTTLGRSVDTLTAKWFHRIQRRGTFVLSSYAVCLIYASMMGSQMLSVLMSGNTLKPQYDVRGLSASSLLQVVGDAPELLPAIIPWNLLGLQAFAILRVPTLVMAPFAWFIILTLAFSIYRTVRACRIYRIDPTLLNGQIT
jgi:Na+:H+ antiporter, NhaC family